MRSINLLPKIKQEDLRFRLIMHAVVRFYVIAGVTFVLVFLVQLGAKFWLESDIRSTKQEIEVLRAVTDKQENADLKVKIKKINNQMADFVQLNSANPKWSKLLRAFANVVPPGVSVQAFAVDSAKRELKISGFAPSRDLVIELYNNVVANKDNWEKINYPLENVSRPDNVAFTFTIVVKESLLK